MAIIKCEECGKDMSDTLRRCPHCGAKQKKQGKKMKSKSKKKIDRCYCKSIYNIVTCSYNI